MTTLSAKITNISGRVAAAISCLFFASIAANGPALKIGDYFSSFFWAQFSGDSLHYGYYGLTTITGAVAGTASTTFSATLQMSNYPLSNGSTGTVNGPLNFVFDNSKPDSIGLCSSKFALVSWLHSIKNGTDAIRFYFPILPIGQAYNLYDYFSIKLNDTMDLQFQGVADSVLAGSFISNVAGKPATIYAKNAIAILTTSANVLRIRSIQINGAYEKLDSSYLNFDLAGLASSAAFYGIDVIDTVIAAPTMQIIPISKGQGAVSIHQPIVDTFSIFDNIGNVSIQLKAGAGNQKPSVIFDTVTPGNSLCTLRVAIPPDTANPCSGLQAFLVFNDGIYGDTINLSRAIRRDSTNCDDMTAPAKSWTPLIVTAQPDTPYLSAILLNSGQKYDRKSMSIIQWLPQMAKPQDSEWVEYDTTQDSLFKMAPGKLFWLADSNSLPIHYGTAVVPALKDTTVIQLNKNGWTDFSIPFRFNQYVGDILNASKKLCGSAIDSSEIDSLEICQWIKSGHTYATDAVYLEIPDSSVGRPMDTLAGGKAFSIYNRFPKNISLLIPPTSVNTSSLLSDTGSLKKRKIALTTGASPWSVKIGVFSHDTEFCSSMFCASMPSNNIPRFYPRSPSLSAISAGVYDAPHNLTYGHAATGVLSNGGAKFDLVYRNGGKTPCPVKIKFERAFGLPHGMRVGLFAQSSSGSSIGSSDSLKTLLGPMQQGSAVVVVGTEDYLKKFYQVYNSRLLLRSFPLFHGIKIVYTVPFNTKTIKFTCIDLMGRSILTRVEPAVSYSGSFDWTGPLARGMYFVEMKATIEGLEQPQVLRRKVLYVR